MDRYIDIKNRIIEYAGQDEDMKAVIVIGPSTREEVKADEYSDLDLIIVSENVNRWYSGGRLKGVIGKKWLNKKHSTLRRYTPRNAECMIIAWR